MNHLDRCTTKLRRKPLPLRFRSRIISVFCLLSSLAMGAGPPEIVRVRVPSENVLKCFPPGTELRGFTGEQFEALVDSALQGYQRQEKIRSPRLLQVRHFARWEPAAGLLNGRSELVVEPSPQGPGELVLNPWTPAIEPGAAAPLVESQADGRTAIRIEGSAPSTVVVPWQLQARPGSRGCGFTLGLPASQTARLVLDVPDGWYPDGPPGIRQGPDPAADPNRKTWQFDGPGGPIDLQFREQVGGRDPRRDAQVWVSGPTRIDLIETSANWTMDWTVDRGRRAPGPFTLLLDAGLELIDVTGASVDGYQAEAVGTTTRVTVRLEDGAGPTIVSVRAVARVPSEGVWTVPAARPLDALWTGGSTFIRLDTSRTLEECRERAGRRVVAPAGEPSDRKLLVFEVREPQPVADLVFRKPAAEISTEVHGRLLLGSSAPRLECQITWRVQRGHLLGFEVDLPPTWVPDRVRIAGVDEPLDWHPEVLPDGAVRVHVVPPASALDRAVPILTVEATATVAGGRGPLALPRVRPAGVRIVDELWVAWTDPSLTLRPTVAKGLAWIDPRLATAGGTNPRAADEEPEGLRGTLAWRWIAPPPQAEARVDRERVETEPSGTIDLRARVDRTRVRYDWQIVVQAGEDATASIALGTSTPPDDSGSWHFEEETSGLALPENTIDARRQALLGLPVAGRAWELLFPHPRRGRVIVHARLEQPWTGRGVLPLLVLPDRFHTRGTVVIEVDRSVRSMVEATGLRALDPAVAAPTPAAAEIAVLTPPSYRRAHAFGYTSAGGRLELRTENLESTRAGAVIREAVLTTTFNPQGASQQHLTLRIATDRTREMALTLPAGAKLSRVERDGLAIVTTRDRNTLSIPLVAPHAARSFCTVTLDYLSDRGSSYGEGILRPPVPETSIPCLSFCWEILAPQPWSMVDNTSGLLPTDPGPIETGAWSRSLSGGWPSLWRMLPSRFRRNPVESPEAALLRSLDALVVRTRPDEVTLGEWFTRWDSGSSPLVIDRVALATAGWGPRSRVVPPRFNPSKAGAAQSALRPLGLTVVPLAGTLLITAQREAPDQPGGDPGESPGRADWAAAAIDAVAWGYDRSDRFQTVASWRGEATPKVSIRGETTESEPLLAGWRYRRFASPGWPSPDASVYLIDDQRRMAEGWAAGLAILLAGIAGRRGSARLRAFALTLLLAFTILGLMICPGRLMHVAWGGLAGVLGVAFLWLGASVPGRLRRRSREQRSTSSWQRLNPGLTTALVLTSLAGVVAPEASSQVAMAPRDGETPIIAVLPYDGAPDPDRLPDRVILRREDAERLQALAALARAPSMRSPRAMSALHRVNRRGDRDITVESTYVIGRDPGQSAAWTFPVEDSREITATLDGRRVPVQIAADGRTGTVILDGSGSQEDSSHPSLKIRRNVTLRHQSTDDILTLAINPVASAQVVVEDLLPDRLHVDVASARGRIGLRAVGAGVAGLLGPARSLDIRWLSQAEAAPAESGGAVEGLMLWDAEPAGDHVQARFTYRKAGGTSTIRLGLEPGMVLRAGSFDGLVDATWQGSDEHPEWVASVDPPLADGATIQLEFWRPAPSAAGEIRTLPRIEPMGIERYSGALGFRRPPAWSGRLVAGAGFDSMTDEAFVKAWGSLSEEPLTFAGTVRFVKVPAVSIATGPLPCQLLIDPEVQLNIQSGRIVVSLSADLTTVAGRCDQVELGLPPGLELLTVEADGLGDWSRPSPSRVLLRFDGAAMNRREVRIQAWLPVPTDPLATAAASPEIDIPWPGWPAGDVRQGRLTIVSPTRFQLVQSSGATLLGPAATAGAGAANSAVYRVDRPEALGRLSWEVEPPRMEVLVQSQLTVLPDYAEWVAVLRYDVSGAGAEVFHLKLPNLWAASARVQVVGDSHQLASETRGANTVWMIRPDHPIWGSQRLIVRSAIPLPRTGTLEFPELSPLGRGGAVDSYLSLVNASGRELVTEGSPGLQPIVDDSRFRAEEFASTPGVIPSVFHVLRDGWTLKVHGPGELHSTGRPADEARVLLAEIGCTLREDGAAFGVAVYEIEPRSGPFLALDPPRQSEALWATVNSVPTPPLLSTSGHWLIPIPPGEEGAGQSQVRLIWKSAPNPSAGEGPHPLPLPALDQPNVPTFVTTHAPATLEVKSPNGSLDLVARERLVIDRLEWQGHRIADALGKLDRSSQRECEGLVSSLVQFELLKRDAERSARWNQTSPLAYRDLRIARYEERVKIASRALADALRNAALDEFAESARIHVGLVADDPSSSTLEIPEPNPNVRLRRLGRPRYFQGESGPKDRAPTLTWTQIPQRGALDRPLDWALGLLSMFAATLAVTFAVSIGQPTRWAGPIALALALIILAIIVSPLALGGGLAMAWLGWMTRPG